MITLDQGEKEVRQERERVIRQVNNRPFGFMGTRMEVNEEGKLVTVPIIHGRGRENKL